MLETGTFGMPASVQTRIKHVSPDSVPPNIFDHTEPSCRKIGPMSPMRSALSQYPILQGVRAVWFTGFGDSAGVSDLLRDVRNLGAMGRTGYGRVVELDLLEAHAHPLSGIATLTGMPIRTLPVETWDRFGLQRHPSAAISLQRPHPPYWSGPSVPCISPLQIDMTGTVAEIKVLAAVVQV